MKEKLLEIKSKLEKMYPSVHFDYFYDEKDAFHEIWYDNAEMDKDKNFSDSIGKFVKELFALEFYDFYIGFDYLKTQQLMVDKSILPIEYNANRKQKTYRDFTNYTFENIPKAA